MSMCLSECVCTFHQQVSEEAGSVPLLTFQVSRSLPINIKPEVWGTGYKALSISQFYKMSRYNLTHTTLGRKEQGQEL